MHRKWIIKALVGLGLLGIFANVQTTKVQANAKTVSTTPAALRGTWYYSNRHGWYTRVKVTKTVISQMNQRSGLAASLKSNRVKVIKPNKYGYWRFKIKGYRPIYLKSGHHYGQPAIKGRFAGRAFSTGKPVYAYHYLPNQLPKDAWQNIPTKFHGSWTVPKNKEKEYSHIVFQFGKYSCEAKEQIHPGVYFGFVFLGQAPDTKDSQKSSLRCYTRTYHNKKYWVFGLRSKTYVQYDDVSDYAVIYTTNDHRPALWFDGLDTYLYKF